MLSTDVPLPNSLKRPLVFGDTEQIADLKKIERQIEEQEEHTRTIKEGELKLFNVTVSYSVDARVEVWAVDKKEAEEIAQDEVDISDYDWEFESAYAVLKK